MNYDELKSFCNEEIKKFPMHEKMYKKEINIAKRFYDNGINLYKELHEKEVKNKHVIPFLLGITDSVENKEFDMIQVVPGSSGGIDIDSDFNAEAKTAIFDYLKEKYGEDKVLNVGTFMRLGTASALKDLLRIYKIDFRESNEFTKAMDTQLSLEENIENFKETDRKNYAFYEKNKEVIDMAPMFIGKIRQAGVHAGGVVILDRPVYELIPVERVSGRLATAFPESGSEQVLDEIGVIKLDILGISILDVIKNTFDNIKGKIYLIEDNDGMRKVVPESYIDEEINKF